MLPTMVALPASNDGSTALNTRPSGSNSGSRGGNSGDGGSGSDKDDSSDSENSDGSTKNDDGTATVTETETDGNNKRTVKFASSFAKRIKEFQSLEQHVASSITVKLKKKDRTVLMRLAAQLDTFAKGTIWFEPAAVFTAGGKTYNLFRDFIEVPQAEVYSAAKKRWKRIHGELPPELYPMRALRYVLTQKVDQSLLDKAVRAIPTEAEQDGQALWIALVHMHFPSTHIFDSSVRTVLDAAKLSDFSDLDGFLEHIHRYLTLASKSTASDFLPKLFQKLLEHECVRFHKRISEKQDDWMDNELEDTFDCFDLLEYASSSQEVLDQAGMYRKSLKSSSQTTVQALVAESLPKFSEVLSELCAAVAEHGKQLRQLSGTTGTPGSNPQQTRTNPQSQQGNKQSPFKAAGWDEAKRTTQPEDGVETAMLEGTPIFYCTKCGWNQSHVTVQHRTKNKGQQQQQKKNNNKRKRQGSSPSQSAGTKEDQKKWNKHVNFLEAFNARLKRAGTSADGKKTAQQKE